MEKNIFQNITILKVVTIALGVIIVIIAVLMFSGKFPGFENKNNLEVGKTIRIYGVIPESIFNTTVDNYNVYTGNTMNFEYSYISKEKMRDSIVTWASQDKMPDIIIADADTITSNQGYFQLIPYTQTSEFELQNTFIDGSSVYNTPFGFYFYPLAVDPLVTFYNKKILRENGLTNSFSYWQDALRFQETLTQRDDNDNVIRSAFAFAGDNVVNNRLITFAMLSQVAGRIVTPILETTVDNNVTVNYDIDLGGYNNGVSEFYKILLFQTAFVDPLKSTYTWNVDNNNVNDFRNFVDGRLAIYFGKASEYNSIKKLNPNLDIGVNYLPQSDTNVITSGDLYGIAITSKPADLQYAYQISKLIASADFSGNLSIPMSMSSARVDTLAGKGGTLLEDIIGKSAMVTEFVFNTNIESVDSLISDMYFNINSGKKTIFDAIDIFNQKFESLYNKK